MENPIANGVNKKEDVRAQVKKHPILITVLVIIIVSTFGIMLAGSSGSSTVTQQSSPAVTEAQAHLSVGDTGYLYEGGSLTQEIEVSTTKDNMGQLVQLAVAGDTLGMAKMIQDGQAFLVNPGTQVKLIDISFPDAYEVRVLSGDHYSESGWLPGEFISRTQLSSSNRSGAN